MSEMEPYEVEMDRLLRQSLKTAVPALPLNFERRVIRAAARDSGLVGRYRTILFVSYTIISALTSLVVMHSTGLKWLPICSIVASLTVIAVALAAWKTRRARMEAPAT